MKTEIKCYGITFDLVPIFSGGAYFSYLSDEKVKYLFDVISAENPTYDDVELRRSAAQVLRQLYPEYYFTLTKPGGILPSRVSEGIRIIADPAAGTLTIDNTGYSLRSLQGAAAACNPDRRKWRIILDTDGTPSQTYVIGEILLKRVKKSD